MKKEEVSKILSLFSVAGVKFEGDKTALLNLWSTCLDDIEFEFALQATKKIIKQETELFANGLIAKLRYETKNIKFLFEAQQRQQIKKIEHSNKQKEEEYFKKLKQQEDDYNEALRIYNIPELQQKLARLKRKQKK